MQLARGFGIAGADVAERALALSALAPNLCCIVTMEERGSVAAKAGVLWRQAALEVEAVDSTGAGDAFCGILAARLQAGDEWTAALRDASVGASLSCTGLGAQAGMPFIEDIAAARAQVPPAQREG
jgi:ribokinase